MTLCLIGIEGMLWEVASLNEVAPDIVRPVQPNPLTEPGPAPTAVVPLVLELTR